MPTRNEMKRAGLNKRKAHLVKKITPLTKEIFYIDEQLKLLDQFERDELAQAEETLGLNNPGNED